MRQQRSWKKERELREAVAEALINEAQPRRHLFSAGAFVRRQSKANRKALSQYLKLPDEATLWSALEKPEFLSSGVIFRLCLWGWNPYEEQQPRRRVRS